MQQRRTMLQVVAVVGLAVLVAGGTWWVLDRDDGAATGEAVADTTGSPSWLFSHTADAGKLTPSDDGTYTLTMDGIDPKVMGFTDRPDRQTMILSAEQLVEAWPTMFADSAPNAVLVEHEPSGETDSLVVVLSDPRLDGPTMTYTVDVLEDEAHPSGVEGIVNSTHVDPPAEFADVSLFIDDVDLEKSVYSCVNGSGQLIMPPGTIPIAYKPNAPYFKLCADADGTITATVVGGG